MTEKEIIETNNKHATQWLILAGKWADVIHKELIDTVDINKYANLLCDFMENLHFELDLAWRFCNNYELQQSRIRLANAKIYFIQELLLKLCDYEDMEEKINQRLDGICDIHEWDFDDEDRDYEN